MPLQRITAAVIARAAAAMAFVPGFHCRFGGTDWFADQVVCPGRLLVLSDGLGLAIGAMGIFTPHGSTGIRPFASAEEP